MSQIHLEMDLTLPEDQVQELAHWLLGYLNEVVAGIKSVFLLQDILATIKFAASKRLDYDFAGCAFQNETGKPVDFKI